MNYAEAIALLVGLVIVALAIPCKYDPAIRQRSWLGDWGREDKR